MIIPNAAFQSSRGRREQNEDAYGVPDWIGRTGHICSRGTTFDYTSQIFAEKGFLFLLADGVGGVDGGEIASATVVADVGQRYYEDPSADISVSLQRVIQAGNRNLRRVRQMPGFAPRMATTLVAAVCFYNNLHLAGVGDSRAYQITATGAHCLTNDHNWIQEQHAAETALSEYHIDLYKHRITRSIGSHTQVGVDTWRLTVKPQDKILLCTDGLSNYLDEQTIASLCYTSALQMAVNNLIDTAFDRGSSDNISAILIEPIPEHQDFRPAQAIAEYTQTTGD